MSNIINREEDLAIMNATTKFTKPSELLIAAKAVIADPKNFTQGTLARDAMGDAVSGLDERAVCWCSIGAYYKAIGFESLSKEFDDNAFACLVRAIDKLNGTGVAIYSDTHTHEEVMAAWDKAIALAVADETGQDHSFVATDD